jgi:hypothetical protein
MVLDKLHTFDKLLKKKAQGETGLIPEDLNRRINSTLACLHDNKKCKSPMVKVLLVAALAAPLFGTTVLANTTPVVENMIN